MESKQANIIITDYKDTSAIRTTFETNLGKMSAFKNEGSTLVEDLKGLLDFLKMVLLKLLKKML